jgi:hypothetical protein
MRHRHDFTGTALALTTGVDAEGLPRVNTDLTGTVRMMGQAESAVRVEIHLEDEELRLVSAHGELGRWSLSDIGVAAKLDGFHLRIEGEELVISTNDDARFALALGIRSSSSPRLNRLLAGARDQGLDRDGRIAPPPPAAPPEYTLDTTPAPHENLTAVAMGLLGAAVIQALGGVLGLASNSALKIVDIVPAWPVWIVAAVTVAAGAFALLNRLRGGRNLVAAGAIVGLVTLAGSLMGVAEPTFSWFSDGVAFGGAGTILAGLLLSVDTLNRGR